MRRTGDTKERDLQGCDLLAGLGSGARRQVARAGEVVTVEEGAVLQRPGERLACWWLVLEGVVVVDDAAGAAVIGSGDGWGADDVLGRRPTRRSAVAATPVRCLVVPRPRLEALLIDVPELSIALLRDRRLGA
jgi:CRP-like cAMP-binding protein